ncbi:MAG: hypothetical protein U9P70_01765 [Patescibacteria group bacterium]|nr:hypothetical protein [Patescibacteria group bacterium]
MSNFFTNHYFKHRLKHEITELYISVAIKKFALSGFWAFLFKSAKL